MKTLWPKNQKNSSDRISHAWAPLSDIGIRCTVLVVLPVLAGGGVLVVCVGNLSPAWGARNQVGILYNRVVVPARQPLQLGYSIPDLVPGIDSSPHSGT